LTLAPYLLGRVRRDVVISGEPGLEKDNLAALIHFGSPSAPAVAVTSQANRWLPG
jgi:transcriptional regulator with AAA-type ATPase domain